VTDEAPPPVSEEEMEELRSHLREMARIAVEAKELKRQRDNHNAEACAILRRVGSLVIANPITHKAMVANVTEAETLKVDAGELLAALIEQYDGDEEQAEMVWRSVLKPPAVDTKENGLFHQACATRPEGEPPISPETVAKVANYEKAAAFVNFSAVGGR
jgi:hypothetical protein